VFGQQTDKTDTAKRVPKQSDSSQKDTK